MTADLAFKNFHRLLCERFGYCHDEQDWQRDQLSLIEFIAAKIPTPAEAHADLARDLEMAAALMVEASKLIDSLAPCTRDGLALFRWPLIDELDGAAGILRDRLAQSKAQPKGKAAQQDDGDHEPDCLEGMLEDDEGAKHLCTCGAKKPPTRGQLFTALNEVAELIGDCEEWAITEDPQVVVSMVKDYMAGVALATQAPAPAPDPVAWIDSHELKHITEGFEPTVSKLPVSERDVPLYAQPVPCAAVGAEAGDWRNYWADEMQKKADNDKARGCLQPVGYYVWSAFIYAGVGSKS